MVSRGGMRTDYYKKENLRVILLSKNLVEGVLSERPEQIKKHPTQANRLIKFVRSRKNQLKKIGKFDLSIKN